MKKLKIIVFLINLFLISNTICFEPYQLKILSSLKLDDTIFSLLYMQNHIIVGLNSGVIKVFDINNIRFPIFKFEFQAHTQAITKIIQIDDLFFASASEDGTIKLWLLNDVGGKPISVFQGHEDGIYSIIKFNNTIISGSLDKTIRIWNIDNLFAPICVSIEREHQDAITCLLKLDDTKFASGSDLDGIIIWDISDLSNPKVITILKKDELDELTCLTLLTEKKIIAGYEAMILLWDITNLQKPEYFTLSSKLENPYCLLNLGEGKIILGSNRIKFFNLISGKTNLKFRKTKSYCLNDVYALEKIKLNTFASGSIDGKIIFWQVKEKNS